MLLRYQEAIFLFAYTHMYSRYFSFLVSCTITSIFPALMQPDQCIELASVSLHRIVYTRIALYAKGATRRFALIHYVNFDLPLNTLHISD